MNFLDAMNAHVLWKQRLTRYLEGRSDERLEPGIVTQDHLCDLGRWIYDNGGRYCASPIFIDVQNEHIRFHEMAARIIRLVDEGLPDQARQLLEGEYAHLSQHLQVLIRRLAHDFPE